ncbi:hypothetical protein KAU88_02020 [Candidatus Bathyarchaeota archaeon]|nr:hypothetical protein [Candidatus Bathyarchaeota archaeon]
MSLIDILLNFTASSRIRLWLRLRFSSWYTVEEIAEGLPLFSKARIQQVLQESHRLGLVYRRKRKTSKPGPNPYEYQVPPLLFNELEGSQLKKLGELHK